MNTLKSTAFSLVALLVTASSVFADEAVLQSILGSVSVKNSAAAAAVKARPGMKLPRGAEVSTGKNARAIIRFSPTDSVRLGPNTKLIVAEVNKNTPGQKDTVLRVVTGSVRAMLNRVGAKRQMNFAIAAGAAVCAVKGTEFDVHFPDQAKAPEVVVSQGTVQVGNAGPDMGAVMAALHSMGAGAGGVPVMAGFRVSVDNAGHVSTPSPAPVRTTLEVVSTTGKVMATVKGVTTEVHPGEEIPAGATVKIEGGEAVLSTPGQAVSAGEGATFTFTAVTTGGGITTNIAAAAGSTPVTVEVGGNIATVAAGSTVQVIAIGTTAPTIGATVGSIAVTNATGTTTTVTQGNTVSTALPVVNTPVPLDSTTGQNEEPTPLIEPTPFIETPPPPPDTTNQTNEVISPSAP